MTKPFFLTQHSANLMEDFIRELKTDAGLYLIYGDQGVGKTRLLEELVHNRLADNKIRWIDLQAGADTVGALVDSSELIERTFIKAEPGDIIVADHFEMALKKSRHQLFFSWSTDGIDKKLNLIIAANTNFTNELRQLAQQYQIHLQSFQLTPFSEDDADAFLGFYLFPDRPDSELTIPLLLRNQMHVAQGNVCKIVEIAERAGDQITVASTHDTESIRQGSRVIAAVLVAVFVVVGVSWYYLSNQAAYAEKPFAVAEPIVNAQQSAEIDESPLADNEAGPRANDTVEVVAVTQADNGVVQVVADTAAVPASQEQGGDENTDSSDELPQLVATSTMASESEVDSSEEASESEVDGSDEADESIASTPDNGEALIAAPADSEMAVKVNDEVAVAGVATGNDSDAASTSVQTKSVTETAATDYASLEQSASDSERLRQDLQSSLEWIAERDGGIGTLQIMLLSQDKFDTRVYYDYVESLARQGVDVSGLRILPTNTRNRDGYSVVYGEYPSRVAASKARANLAAVLRKASPIARSVGSLREEIRRLEDKN